MNIIVNIDYYYHKSRSHTRNDQIHPWNGCSNKRRKKTAITTKILLKQHLQYAYWRMRLFVKLFEHLEQYLKISINYLIEMKLYKFVGFLWNRSVFITDSFFNIQMDARKINGQFLVIVRILFGYSHIEKKQNS